MGSTLLFVLLLLISTPVRCDEDAETTTISPKIVPGCPDVDVLENDESINQDSLKDLLLCFCKIQKNDKVAISCLYGSNEEQLMRAASAVKNASLEIDKISIQHMDFPLTGLPDIKSAAPNLRSLEIRECGTPTPLIIDKTHLAGLEKTLKNFTVHGCTLEEVPDVLTDLNDLESIDLSSNKIQTVPTSAFINKKQLTYLDLSANLINSIEEGAFANLDNLETFVFGERNYINDTVLEELKSLKNLKNLDLTRADGVFEPPSGIFDSLQNLESLKLSGCSIPNLETGVFAPLNKLKQLDLRVNLIENISDYAFDGLTQLERLSLAGNYIRKLEQDVWVGLHNLKELDLGWNEITTISKESLKPLVENLTVLSLKHNPLTEPPATGLINLESLSLAECSPFEIKESSFEDLNKLKILDLSSCNIEKLPPNAFEKQKSSLLKLNLDKNMIKTIPAQILKDLPLLEEFTISNNPYQCDSEMTDFLFLVEDRRRDSSNNGQTFVIPNINTTKCNRPYSLKDLPLILIDAATLQPYDEATDTTTQPPTTTAGEEIEESTTPFTIPDFFVGVKDNVTLFKEEPRREVYDINQFDNPKNGKVEGSESNLVVPVTIGIITVVSIIAIVAVALFMKKTNRIGSSQSKQPDAKQKKASIEDGMEEIELDNHPK
ncbi:unnamed protein product [Auanema sp. JU1783]|nr:unnamed protein product [Auanema sp. JU1783]